MTSLTKIAPRKHTHPYVTKTPPKPVGGPPYRVVSEPTVFVIKNARLQLIAVATELASPLISAGKISHIRNHGIAPMPHEKNPTYAYRAMAATILGRSDAQAGSVPAATISWV